MKMMNMRSVALFLYIFAWTSVNICAASECTDCPSVTLGNTNEIIKYESNEYNCFCSWPVPPSVQTDSYMVVMVLQNVTFPTPGTGCIGSIRFPNKGYECNFEKTYCLTYTAANTICQVSKADMSTYTLNTCDQLNELKWSSGVSKIEYIAANIASVLKEFRLQYYPIDCTATTTEPTTATISPTTVTEVPTMQEILEKTTKSSSTMIQLTTNQSTTSTTTMKSPTTVTEVLTTSEILEKTTGKAPTISQSTTTINSQTTITEVLTAGNSSTISQSTTSLKSPITTAELPTTSEITGKTTGNPSTISQSTTRITTQEITSKTGNSDQSIYQENRNLIIIVIILAVIGFVEFLIIIGYFKRYKLHGDALMQSTNQPKPAERTATDDGEYEEYAQDDEAGYENPISIIKYENITVDNKEYATVSYRP